MWRVIRPSVAGKGDGRSLPDISPNSLNRFFVGVGPRVASEVRDMGQVPHLPCRLPRVGACALTLSPLTLSELRTTVFSMSGSAASGEDGISIRMSLWSACHLTRSARCSCIWSTPAYLSRMYIHICIHTLGALFYIQTMAWSICGIRYLKLKTRQLKTGHFSRANLH